MPALVTIYKIGKLNTNICCNNPGAISISARISTHIILGAKYADIIISILSSRNKSKAVIT